MQNTVQIEKLFRRKPKEEKKPEEEVEVRLSNEKS